MTAEKNHIWRQMLHLIMSVSDVNSLALSSILTITFAFVSASWRAIRCDCSMFPNRMAVCSSVASVLDIFACWAGTAANYS